MKKIVKILSLIIICSVYCQNVLAQSFPDSAEILPYKKNSVNDPQWGEKITKNIPALTQNFGGGFEIPSKILKDGLDSRVFPSSGMQATASISIDKQNPANLLVTSEIYNGGYKMGYFYSSDGNLTWNGQEQWQNNSLLLSDKPRTAANSGSLFFRSAENGFFVGLQSSNNGGNTWNNMTTIYGDIINNPVSNNIVTDNDPNSPHVNKVYAAWNLQNAQTGTSTEVLFSKSIDNGISFGAPITLKNGPGTGVDIQTGPNGEVYACWSDRAASDPAFPYKGTGFCWSGDGGNTFTQPVRVLSYTGVRDFFAPNANFNNTIVLGHPVMAIDKSLTTYRGRIYIANNLKENGNGKSIIQVSHSDDHGSTWSNPVTVNIPGGRQNWNSDIAVDDCSGAIWVVYYSFDTPSGFTTNTYVAYSSDGGNTWTNQKVSDVSHITAPINNTLFLPGYAGWYNSIAAYGGKAYPVWSDNRSGNWQLYCSTVTAGACTPPIGLWPKTYQVWDGVYNNNGNSFVSNANNNTVYFTTSSTNIQNNINHVGTLPATTNSNFLIQYSPTGVSGWTRPNLTDNSDVFVFNNGTIRTKISTLSSQYIHLDATNTQIPMPAFIPSDERVLAETNSGNVITYKNGVISFRSASISTSVIATVIRSYFNTSTNKLFIEGTNGNISIFTLIGNNLNLITTFTLPLNTFGSDPYAMYHVDNQDNIYVLPMMRGLTPLYKYDWVSNSLVPVSIAGFNNSNIAALKYGGSLSASYTSDKCMVANVSSQKLQVIDLFTASVKSINATGDCFYPASELGFPTYSGCSYHIDGDLVYLSGWLVYYGNSTSATVGNQTVSNIASNGASSFIFKLNLLSDFNRAGVQAKSGLSTPVLTPSFSVKISPNPVIDILKISITEDKLQNEQGNYYKILMTDKTGNILKQNVSKSLVIRNDISNLKLGVYYISIMNSKGEVINKIFIKQ